MNKGGMHALRATAAPNCARTGTQYTAARRKRTPTVHGDVVCSAMASFVVGPQWSRPPPKRKENSAEGPTLDRGGNADALHKDLIELFVEANDRGVFPVVPLAAREVGEGL